jgi:hypothetical protein
MVAGALMLVWPALLAGYPLVFSDTGAFLHQTLGPLMIWDKPWIYGPLMHLFHWRISLWPVVLVQGLMLSHLIWLLARSMGGGATPVRHLLLCGAVAALTAAPFSAALVMPDVLTPAVVICVVLLGFARGALTRAEVAWLSVLGAVGTGSHLSHLPVIAALLVVVLALAGWRAAGRVAVPLAGAMALLLATNLAGHGRLSLSPYGATFLLARLVANGSAIRTIEARCPEPGWAMCEFKGKLATYGPEACANGTCPRGLLPSDEFLWKPTSPVNQDAVGNTRWFGGRTLSGEARAILWETIRREPLRVALDGVRDTFEQLVTARVGDTLTRAHIGEGVLGHVQRFGPREVARFQAGAQWQDRMTALVAPFLWVQGPALVLGSLTLVVLGWHGRRDRPAVGLVACIAVGLLANSFATGALSGPHDRYGARVAWLVVLGAAVLGMRAWNRTGRMRHS